MTWFRPSTWGIEYPLSCAYEGCGKTIKTELVRHDPSSGDNYHFKFPTKDCLKKREEKTGEGQKEAIFMFRVSAERVHRGENLEDVLKDPVDMP